MLDQCQDKLVKKTKREDLGDQTLTGLCWREEKMEIRMGERDWSFNISGSLLLETGVGVEISTGDWSRCRD